MTKAWGSFLPKEVDYTQIEARVLLDLIGLLNTLKAPHDSSVEKMVIGLYLPDAFDPKDFLGDNARYENDHGDFISLLLGYWIGTDLFPVYSAYQAFDGPYSDVQEYLEYLLVRIAEDAPRCRDYDDDRTPMQIRKYLKNLGKDMFKRQDDIVKTVTVITEPDSNVYALPTVYVYTPTDDDKELA